MVKAHDVRTGRGDTAARARRRILEIANDGKRSPIMKCVQLQASMEHALKALTIARGERVKHKHTLNELWDDVEQAGKRFGRPETDGPWTC